MEESKTCQSTLRNDLFTFLHISLLVVFFLFNLSILFILKNIDFVVQISFLINLSFLFFIGWKVYFNKNLSIMDSVLVTFFYSFFWLAPILQLNQGNFPYFRETDPYLIASTNLIILVFFLSYFGSKIFLKTKIRNLIQKKEIDTNDNTNIDKLVFSIYLILSFWIVFAFSRELFNYFFSGVGLIPFDAEGQIIRKFVFYLPTFPLYYLVLNNQQKKDPKKKKSLLLFAYALLLFFLFKNPFNEKRNAVGPLYLSIISIYLIKKGKATNKIYIVTLLLVLIFAFPIISVLTHSQVNLYEAYPSLTQRIQDNRIQSSLTTGDFDSWSMMLAVNAYCKDNGYTYGNQILGNLLFFVPRIYWPSKSYGSGHFIVNNYLKNTHGFYFTNVSCPFPAEGYINFGIIGTLFFGIVLGILGIFTDYYLFSGDKLKREFAHFVPFSTVMLLRGDLNSGFAYLIAPLFAIYFVPKLLRFFLKKLIFITNVKKSKSFV